MNPHHNQEITSSIKIHLTFDQGKILNETVTEMLQGNTQERIQRGMKKIVVEEATHERPIGRRPFLTMRGIELDTGVEQNETLGVTLIQIMKIDIDEEEGVVSITGQQTLMILTRMIIVTQTPIVVTTLTPVIQVIVTIVKEGEDERFAQVPAYQSSLVLLGPSLVRVGQLIASARGSRLSKQR